MTTSLRPKGLRPHSKTGRRIHRLITSMLSLSVVLITSSIILHILSRREADQLLEPKSLLEAGISLLIGFVVVQAFVILFTQAGTERDLLRQQLDQFSSALRVAHERFHEFSAAESDEASITQLVSALKSAGVELTLLDRLCEELGFTCPTLFDEPYLEDLFVDYRMITTSQMPPHDESVLPLAGNKYQALQHRLVRLRAEITRA